MQELHEKNSAYQKRVTDLEQDNVRLEEERRRLVTDPVYFEKVAREKMGIIRDDEVIYKVLPPGQKRSTASADADGLIKTTSESLVEDLNLFPDDPTTPAPKTAVVKKKKKASVAGKTVPMTKKTAAVE